jgi:hypothetical protein
MVIDAAVIVRKDAETGFILTHVERNVNIPDAKLVHVIPVNALTVFLDYMEYSVIYHVASIVLNRLMVILTAQKTTDFVMKVNVHRVIMETNV